MRDYGFMRFRIKGSFFAFCWGILFGCAVFSVALLYSGVFELPVAVSKTLPVHVETFSIHMKVDFGPAGKPVYDQVIDVEKGTTPKDAVSQVFPVLSGKSCCSLKEVVGIDGVRVDASKGRWWICLVNGSKNISPQRKKLKKGDTVEWKYIQD